MGGQACVFYGAAEFSRDLDLLILADALNLANLKAALDALDAAVIAVPPFEQRYLLKGHAVHFRQRESPGGLRIDVMSRLRGVADFGELWARRTSIEVEGAAIDLLAIEDLVRAKKTQRDKDWPMIRRLVERSYFQEADRPSDQLASFWLRELRTPELLVEAATAHPALAEVESQSRPAVRLALLGRLEEVSEALAAEESEERRKDREYWAPLKRELEELRMSRRREGTSEG